MRTAKAWVAAIGAVLTAVSTSLVDDVFNAGDLSNVVTAVIMAGATLWAVYQVPNAPERSVR